MTQRHHAGTGPLRVFGRIEEIVMGATGADPFELVYALATARLYAQRKRRPLAAASRFLRRDLERLVRAADEKWPGLSPSMTFPAPDAVLAASLELLDDAAIDGDGEGLDALFEQLVTRVGKGDKGQYFTPRHVVDFATRALALEGGERFLDPACGSGAFVSRARAAAKVHAGGWDIDPRAVRVAKLLAVATGADPARIEQRDSLARRERVDARFDAIATNPPFAGSRDGEGYEVARLGGRVERDALFLERCVSLLRPGGRLAIVLPHGKVASPAWAPLRRWLVERARVLAVVSLPRETFLPHTSQRTALVLAKKRQKNGAGMGERVLLAVSDRAGRDKGGVPIFRRAAGGRTWRDHDHDLDTLERDLFAFLRREHFSDVRAC